MISRQAHKVPLLVVLSLAAPFFTPRSVHAQASTIPSVGAPAITSKQEEEQGRKLLDQMLEAMGGEAWLSRTSTVKRGHTATFFQGRPTLNTVDFWEFHRFPTANLPEAERYEFTKKGDIVQIWTADQGYEITYKGSKPLPANQVADYIRRRNHSIESIYSTWLKRPGTIVVYEGTTLIERRLADTVTLLADNDDALSVYIDANTHLPLRRTFKWRNTTYKDYDEDSEDYDDYHVLQGIPTPMTISRYRDGDLANQKFYISVDYDTPLDPEMFAVDRNHKATAGKPK